MDRAEKDCLINLSKVRKKLLQNCSSETIKDTLLDIHLTTTTGGVHDFKSRILSGVEDGESFQIDFLLLLLQSKSKVIQHAAVKTLFALSSALRRDRAVACWISFLLRLWTATQYWVSRGTSDCSGGVQNDSTQNNGKYLDLSHCQGGHLIAHDLIGVPHLEDDLLAASNAVDLLRKVLKACHQDVCEDLQETKQFFRQFEENIRGLVNAICTKVKMIERRRVQEEPIMLCGDEPTKLLAGSTVRLLCTATRIVLAISQHSNANDINLVGAFLETMEALAPILSSCVLFNHMNQEDNSCLSLFLCYKLLMVIMRLSECYEKSPSLGLPCLTSIRDHGNGLLRLALPTATSEEADSLKESPFFISMVKIPQPMNAFTAPSPSFKHLQRRVLYIIFKNESFSRGASTPKEFTQLQGAVSNPETEDDCQGASMLQQNRIAKQMIKDWFNLQATFVSDLAFESNFTQDINNFDQLAKSFVSLFAEEDDLMFKMLLLLTNQPSIVSRLTQYPQDCRGSEHPTDFLVRKAFVEVFRPERVFHAFLATIQYSSSVLVDFLISEESGSLCLLYLMRSMGFIANSWPAFLHSSGADKKRIFYSSEDSFAHKSLLFSKKRRLDQFESADEWKTGSVGVRAKDDNGQIRNQKHDEQGYTLKRARCSSSLDKISFASEFVIGRAADCLVQVKLLIQRLNQRSLFPYNPSTLLKRLETVLEHLNDFLMDARVDD